MASYIICRCVIQWGGVYASDCGTKGYGAGHCFFAYESGIGICGIRGMADFRTIDVKKRAVRMRPYVCGDFIDSVAGEKGKDLTLFICKFYAIIKKNKINVHEGFSGSVILYR